MVTGVIGVTLWTDDLERMFDFYHNVLRLPLHSRHDDFIAFELGEVRSVSYTHLTLPTTPYV